MNRSLSLLGRLASVATIAALTVGLAGCSSLSQIKTDLLRPSAAPVPVNTAFLDPSFAPSAFDPALVVSEICVDHTAAPASIQSFVDAKDGCAAMTDRPFNSNPRGLFQHVDAGGALHSTGRQASSSGSRVSWQASTVSSMTAGWPTATRTTTRTCTRTSSSRPAAGTPTAARRRCASSD